MSNDIVTRLRERAEERMEASEDYWQGYKFEYDIPYIENQAADEIERLRRELHMAEKWRDNYKLAFEKGVIE